MKLVLPHVPTRQVLVPGWVWGKVLWGWVALWDLPWGSDWVVIRFTGVGWGLEWTSSHQCTSSGWGRSSCFGDEPKTHPPLPKIFGFFNLFFAPKFFPPTYLTSICNHSIVRAQESLKQEGRRGRAKLGTKSGRAEMVVRTKRLKQKGRNERLEVRAKSEG